MLTGSYRKRLEADLTRWVGEGLVSSDSAAAIRRSLGKGGGFRLPALLGMFGGLLIASSVAAFVAANWEEMPRLMKLGMILVSIIVALAIAARLEAKGSGMGSDAAATCGTLIFAAGVALVGQMYHLPTDWPGGALLIALGALATAILLRSDGALIIAFVALTSWSVGRWLEQKGAPHLPFFLLFVPAFWLALGRRGRFVHHVAVLALACWLGLVPGDWINGRFDYGIVAYGIAVSVVFVAIGALALDRGLPALLTAFLPWGLLGLLIGVDIELIRILDDRESLAGSATLATYLGYGFAVPAVAAVAALARDRRFAWPLAAAALLALVIPVVFWSGGVVRLPGKVAVASLILLIAVGLVVAGAAGGIRRLTLAGSGLFGIAILILLWQTIGTLLDQSLFFLAAGAALLALASGARRLVARFSRAPAEAA
ncbi:DUF2157 domain-containing protein [Bosea sp. PAMC 26642]|uniref:DUF2157 domain-containing protein n=1 Tax=Bosea sp. (strain PAMC 26642) TaxID=1792307 RepID=UPI000770147F|nr:DUF2157 domain-containing protein [Bosea sp. PAMC 26642]AMJ60418.1 hypothetical protein AXW83_09050 [Bosea sp. PAMC 26642]